MADFETIATDLRRFFTEHQIKELELVKKTAESDPLVDFYYYPIATALCELGCRLMYKENHFDRATADIMVCHSNNSSSGLLNARVLAGFPSYRLDRFDQTKLLTQLHLRHVVYEPYPNPKVENRDVIAKALFSGRDHYEEIAPDSKTISESELRGVRFLVPSTAARLTLPKIRPGMVVGMSLCYFKQPPSLSPGGVIDSQGELDRFHDVLDLFTQLSLFRVVSSNWQARWKQNVLAKLFASEKTQETLVVILGKALKHFVG